MTDTPNTAPRRFEPAYEPGCYDYGPQCYMEEMPEGGWISYEDHTRLVEEAVGAALDEAAGLIRRVAEGYHNAGHGAVARGLYLAEVDIRTRATDPEARARIMERAGGEG